ncbi:MAG: type II and III secretion system protein family protein [Alphaproteobacteria bacterium]|mgnify:FL=1|nr:type II and III secretion system protein family protein [Alphaproteobacteria bacterium]
MTISATRHPVFFLRGFLFLGLLLAAAPAAAKPEIDEANARLLSITTHGASVHQRLTLSLDKAAIVQLDADARDVLVSNPDMVDAIVRTPRRIFLLANKVGQTNAFFFDANGKQILSLDIRVERDVTDLSTLMHASMPNSSIKVQALNDNVVLTGSVSSAIEASHAADLAARFAGDPKKVVNMISVAAGQQVMLKVRIAEMDRNIAKQFGIDLTAAAKIGGVPMVTSTSNPYGLLGRALSDMSGSQIGSVCPQAFTPTVTTNIATSATTGSPATTTTSTNTSIPCSSPNNAQGVLKALEQVGLVHMLAEPNLTAVSGETAKFLAGGEFPVPASRDRDGNVTVVFKQFGVGLSFTPVVLSPGRISIQLSSEVSELSNTGSFLLNGSTSGNGLSIPALSVRRTETTIELPSGGSFAVAGLMQHNTKQVIDGFPGVKDLPVLGALFRSRDFQNDETELVVLVSAYLVEPTAEGALAAPTDGFVAPTDPETLLLGRLNAVYRKDAKPVTPQAAAPVGFVVR